MYTRRAGPKKISLLPTEEPTLLGSAIAAAVRGRTEYLQELMVEYFRADESQNITHLAELLLRTLGEIHLEEEPTDKQNLIIERAAEDLRKSHDKFRAAVTWLCSPKHLGPARRTSLRLLASGKWQPGRYPSIDEPSEKHIKYLEAHGLRHFRIHLSLQEGRLVPAPRIEHLIDLFCAYLLDRCLDRKVSEMPIKICPKCGKMFLSQRKQFCSGQCQWKSYWTAQRRADDKWVKDLKNFAERCKPRYGRSISDLRERLERPKVVQRLKSIKRRGTAEDWRGWTRILERIKSIEGLASRD